MRRPFLALLSSFAVASTGIGALVACGGNTFVAAPADASSVFDASADTSGTSSFCATEGGAATFCDDFDRVPLTPKWDEIDETMGATIAHVSALSFSPPNSLDSNTPVSLGGVQRARVEKIFATASSLVVSFQLHIDAVAAKPTGVGGTSLVTVTLGDISVGIAANDMEVSYFEDATTDAGDVNLLSGDIVLTGTVKGGGSDGWVPVTLTVDLKNAELTASVFGTAKGPIPITPPAGATPAVYVGIQSRNIDGALEAHYDNVLINVTP